MERVSSLILVLGSLRSLVVKYRTGGNRPCHPLETFARLNSFLEILSWPSAPSITPKETASATRRPCLLKYTKNSLEPEINSLPKMFHVITHAMGHPYGFE